MQISRLYIALLPAFLFLLASCTFRPIVHPRLASADSLMNTRPDSALHLLESLSVEELRDEADRAFYALLLTQARDKNEILQTDDSLIKAAVEYYDRKKEVRMQGMAYYLWGRFFQTKSESASGIEKYLIAIPYVRQSRDSFLLGRLYNNIGYVYCTQHMYERAEPYFQQAEQISCHRKDTILWIESIYSQGQIALLQEQYQQAESRLRQAEKISAHYPHRQMHANITSCLGSLFRTTGEYEKSLDYIRQSMFLQQDSIGRYYTYLLLGDVYYQIQQYDSAIFYVTQSLASSQYGLKANAYMRLADIYNDLGDIAKSHEMEYRHSAYRDSVRLLDQRMEIVEKEQQIQLDRQDERHIELQSRYGISIYILGCLAFLALLFMLYKRNQKRKSFLLEQEKRVRLQERQKDVDVARKQVANILQNTLKYSDVYTKLNTIIEEAKQNGFSKTELDEAEWIKLMEEADPQQVVAGLSGQYHLTSKEQHLCCLNLLGLNTTDKARAFHNKTATIYRQEKTILQKMGEEYEPGKLESLLKRMSVQ